jgi:hypothetical protein
MVKNILVRPMFTKHFCLLFHAYERKIDLSLSFHEVVHFLCSENQKFEAVKSGTLYLRESLLSLSLSLSLIQWSSMLSLFENQKFKPAKICYGNHCSSAFAFKLFSRLVEFDISCKQKLLSFQCACLENVWSNSRNHLCCLIAHVLIELSQKNAEFWGSCKSIPL